MDNAPNASRTFTLLLLVVFLCACTSSKDPTEKSAAELCDEMPDSAGATDDDMKKKYSCYYTLALETKNMSLCERIKGFLDTGGYVSTEINYHFVDYARRCYNDTTADSKDPAICEKIAVEYRPECYRRFGLPFSYTLCDSILKKTSRQKLPEYKHAYSDECFLHTANETKNLSLCENILGYSIGGNFAGPWLIDNHYECYLGIALSLDSAACKSIPLEYQPRCYTRYNLSLEKGICDRIKAQPKHLRPYKNLAGYVNAYADSCYGYLARETGNTTPCARITQLESRNLCYLWLVKETNDAGICELINDTGDTNNPEYGRLDLIRCYAMATNQTGNPETCDIMAEKSDNVKYYYLKPHINNCYLTTAERTRNKTICEKITDERVKNNCIKRIDRKYEEESANSSPS